MEWLSTIGAVSVPLAIALAGWVLKLQGTISNVLTRLDTAEQNNKVLHDRVDKRDDEIACLDRKVDDIRVELGKIETKLDILLKDK